MSATLIPLDEHLLHRILAEFRDVPGMRLTEAQARRLWGLDRATCDAVLTRLTEAHALARDASGYIHMAEAGPAAPRLGGDLEIS